MYVETLMRKNYGLISEPHSNLESTKCVKRLQPNPGMTEPSPICLRSKQPNPGHNTRLNSLRRD